jgi:uncharacterized membrane protein YvlD (DUF360 family)
MTDDAAPVRTRHRIKQAVVLFLVSAGLLWATIAVVPGISVSDDGDVLLATLILAVVSAVLRPVLAAFAALLGWLGIVVVGLVAQALIFYAALSVAPGVELSGFWPAFWASWLYALLIGAVGWLFDANDDELFLQDVLHRAHGKPSTPLNLGAGVVIVQIDGLAAPLLRWAIQTGDLPTLSRWVRSGSHLVTDWRAQLPATTPASQAGILHGRSDAVPAFRWYEKENVRLTVTNHPKDAAYVEAGMSDGRGLLADGGVSIGNIFSGDATQSLLTMSAEPRRGPSRRFAAAYMRPFGFTRSLVLTVGEMCKEVYQRRRQRLRDVQPRIDRRGSYVALRGLTNVVLRDLNVRLLAEQMVAGTPVMYCDFTDYDEVAHHAGPTRPESLASLLGVDRAIGILERAARLAPRPYQFVVLSDHGQSQGSTFRQRYGEPLEDVVRNLMRSAKATDRDEGTSLTSTGRDEEWGPVTTLLSSVGSGRGPVATASRHVVHRHESHRARSATNNHTDLIVTASGNLAFVYFTESAKRLSLEDLQRAYPGLVDGLAHHDGVGFVVVQSDSHGLVALGSTGTNYLDEHRVVGHDPLEPFGPAAPAEVRRHGRLLHVGDIVVNSRIDAATGEVAAFEELVGCHGGLGGWQSDAILLHPSDWTAPGQLVGADAVHQQLVQWLEALGQRMNITAATRTQAPVAGP